MYRLLFALLLLSLSAGCRGDEPATPPPAQPITPDQQAPPTPARSDTAAAQEMGDTASANFEGTAGILAQPASGPTEQPIVLRAVRTAAHPSFDRVVFEFNETAVPGYHIEYIDKPVRQCGSGNVVEIAGDGWLEVRMYLARAHTEAGQATIAERERMIDLPILKEVESTCDFEGVVTCVLGMASPNRYRVLTLTNPPRLVVDVKH